MSLGGVFAGESMFHHVADASKVAFVTLAAQIASWEFSFIDCQLHTDHLASLGAQEWPRREYLRRLEASMAQPTRRCRWRLEPGFATGALGET